MTTSSDQFDSGDRDAVDRDLGPLAPSRGAGAALRRDGAFNHKHVSPSRAHAADNHATGRRLDGRATTDSLSREINKRRPFDSLEQEVYLNLARTRSVLEAHTLKVLKTRKLTESSYNVLRILRGWRLRSHDGEPEARPDGGRTCSEIAGDMVVRAADVTRLVDRLQRMGLVNRRKDATDGRAVLVSLTNEGLELTNELDDQIHAAHRTQLGHMSAEELSTLNDLLWRARRSRANAD